MILRLLFTMLCNGSQASDDRYQFQVQPVVWAQVGLCVLVPYTFKYPQNSWRNTYGYWYRLSRQPYNQKEDLMASNYYWDSPSTKKRFQLVGNPEDGKFSLLITDVQKSDQGIYYFQVENDLMKPDIYILEPLWPNRWGTVICVFNATFDECPAPSFSWTGSVLSTNWSQVSTHQPSVLKIAPRPQDQRIDLTCSVRFAPQDRIFQKTVRLDVAYAPKDLIIRVSQVKGAAPQSRGNGSHTVNVQAQQGSFLQLLCEASSHPPASLSWSLGDRVLSYSNFKDPKALALELHSVQVGDAGSYTCCAKNALGQRMRLVHLEVQYAPEDLSVTVSIENGTETPPTCTCESQGSWPLVLTVIRGTLMGTGFLLTYGLTWVYYSRCQHTRGQTHRTRSYRHD